MTLKKQLLLLLLIHVFAALAAWDGYRIGYHKGRGERLTTVANHPNGAIRYCGDWRKNVTYEISDTVKDPDTDIFYVATKQNRDLVPKDHPEAWAVFSRPQPTLGRETWDANWRLN